MRMLADDLDTVGSTDERRSISSPSRLALEERVAALEAELERARAEVALLRDMAFTDPLTGLHNRRSFEERLRLEISRCRRQPQATFALALFDLDDFKALNDTLGHLAGDELLKRVATTLKNSVREYDVVCRTGGDEFVLILPDTPRDAAQRAVARVLAQLDRIEHLGFKAGASVGLATWPADGASADAIIAHADAQMYANKQRRKGVRMEAFKPPGAA
jgi:diguanylate cyclase (GGDEF)-like protein